MFGEYLVYIMNKISSKGSHFEFLRNFFIILIKFFLEMMIIQNESRPILMPLQTRRKCTVYWQAILYVFIFQIVICDGGSLEIVV